MTARRKRLAILHSPRTAPGSQHHLISVIADMLETMGVDIVHLYGTGRFVEADAVFVHVDLSVVPEGFAEFAKRYPLQVNAFATDIRKHTFVDGLLNARSDDPGRVIVKSDLNYGGVPELNERSLLERAAQRLQRLITGAQRPRILTKKDYRIFSRLKDVPAEFFAPDTVVQKLVVEQDGDKYLLREYIFLGDQHFENIERSAGEIITDDEHISCTPYTPHPRLLEMRRRLKLDYGKIDYVMEGGTPFIFDANKTPGAGEAAVEFAADYKAMLRAFSSEICRMLDHAPKAETRQP